MKRYIFEKLITHGLQFPVRLLVIFENLFKSYSYLSQAKQDKIVLELLNGKEEGWFVELGGSNGVTSSNTYVLEKKYGWKGICIEANKRFYKHLIKNRNCKTVRAVVSDDRTEVFFNNDGATGHIDTKGEKMVSAPLAQILKENDAPKVIDYLSLDVEGYEEQVLHDFPFDQFRFRVMTIERPSDRLHNKLIEEGYDLHSVLKPGGNWLDNIYVDPQLI